MTGLGLIHGFNRNPSLFAGLSADLRTAGIQHRVIDYGFSLTLQTSTAVRRILEHCPPGSSLIAHSNGCIAAYIAATRHGLALDTLIMIQPPIACNIRMPPNIRRAVCIWNTGDWLVTWAPRYHRLACAILPGQERHQYYGEMGRYGPAPGSTVESVQVSHLYGHCGIFTRPDWRAVVVDLALLH